jgi:two-component system response regulator GlrR
MMLYDWPGNVRELENKMEYAVAMCQKAVISPEDIFLAPEAGSGEQQVKALEEARLEFEKEYLINLLKINKGHVARAAKMAKRQRSDIYYLIKKYILTHQITVGPESAVSKSPLKCLNF